MTLVVARIKKNRIAVVSDTLVSSHGKQLPLLQGVIKSCMLPGDICVSFSNSPELAERDLTRFALSYPKGCDFADVISFFEDSSRKTENEYIVCFSEPPRIVKITGGKRVHGPAPTLWIGDKTSYEAFREYEANVRAKLEAGRAISGVLFADELTDSPASDLYSIMRNVAGNPSIRDVGGLVTVISNRTPGFRHSVYCDMLYNWPTGEADEFKLRESDPVTFGASDENLGYAMAQISTNFLGLNIVAYYFVRAETLILYYPEKGFMASSVRIFKNVKSGNIVSTLIEFFGRDFDWRMLITSSSLIPSKTEFRDPTSRNDDGGNQFSFHVHENTFPKSR